MSKVVELKEINKKMKVRIEKDEKISRYLKELANEIWNEMKQCKNKHEKCSSKLRK